MCVTWRIYLCDMTHLEVWRIPMFDMVFGYVWYDVLLCMLRCCAMCEVMHAHTYRMVHFRVWHDFSQHVTWRISTPGITHFYVRHASFLRVTWPISTCEMTHDMTYTWRIPIHHRGDLESLRAAMVYMSHVTWTCLVICEYATSYLNESCRTRTNVFVLLWYTWVMSLEFVLSYVNMPRDI